LLDPKAASIIVVGDAKQFLPVLRQAHPEVEVIPAASVNLESPKLR
jgi:zinc protease